jgi:DNA-binding NtrC family response regulator
MPLLHERKEDIAPLAEYFLARKARSRTPKRLTPGALALLTAYDWPGNVRELEHVLEGAMLLSAGDVIDESDLGPHVYRGSRPGGGSSPVPPTGNDGQALSLDEVERRHIESVLKKNGFNRARTADELGISKKTLYLKIKRYGLAP